MLAELLTLEEGLVEADAETDKLGDEEIDELIEELELGNAPTIKVAITP